MKMALPQRLSNVTSRLKHCLGLVFVIYLMFFGWLGLSDGFLSAGVTRKIVALDQKVPDLLDANIIQDEKYTIVVSTYQRDDLLGLHIDHWLSCPSLFQLQIVWHNPDREIPDFFQDMEKEYDCSQPDFKGEEDYCSEYPCKECPNKRLLFRRMTTNSITNRWLTPEGGFQTEAVFSIDDDVVIDCRMLETAFYEWKRMGKYAMVGFEPRIYDWTAKDNMGYSAYKSCKKAVCGYNYLFATKGGFLHRDFYEFFFEDQFKETRDLVSKYITGEDMLMSFVHFTKHVQLFGSPPPILAVEREGDFKREFRKVKGRQEAVIKEFGMGEEDAAGLSSRTVNRRADVTASIGKQADELLGSGIVPQIVHKWLFIGGDGRLREVWGTCGFWEFHFAPTCTNQKTLQPKKPFLRIW